MIERVTIETSFVSYWTARPSRALIVAGHQQITHDWWDTRRGEEAWGRESNYSREDGQTLKELEEA